MPVIKTIILSIVGVMTVSLAGTGVNFVFGRDVTVVLDGEPTTITVVHGSVAEVLAAQGIELGPRDQVRPDLATVVGDKMVITVDYARRIDLTLNGRNGYYWTTSHDVAGVLDSLGLGLASVRLSAPTETYIPRDGLSLSVDTAFDVHVTADGKTKPVHAFGTVAEALQALGLTWDEDDIITPDPGAALKDGLEISLVRVDVKTITREKPIPYTTQNSDDPNSPRGLVTVITAGSKGVMRQTVDQILHDGKVTQETVTAETVVRKPVTEVTKTGTKAPTVTVSPGSAQEIAYAQVIARGWDDAQFQCLNELWKRESGWRVNASNPYSGAYGIPQALPGSKMASAGDDWRTNPATQIKWGLGYIKSRYGTPCGAWSHFQGSGWY